MHRVATVDGFLATVDGFCAAETLTDTKKKFEDNNLLFAALRMWEGSIRYSYNLETQGDGNVWNIVGVRL
jgi:hypothetical protein